MSEPQSPEMRLAEAILDQCIVKDWNAETGDDAYVTPKKLAAIIAREMGLSELVEATTDVLVMLSDDEILLDDGTDIDDTVAKIKRLVAAIAKTKGANHVD